MTMRHLSPRPLRLARHAVALLVLLACGGPGDAGPSGDASGAAAGAASAAAPAAAVATANPHKAGDAVRGNPGFPVCRTRESYDRLVQHFDKRDRAGFAAHMDNPQSACVILAATDQAVVREVSGTHVSVRMSGAPADVWGTAEAWIRK